MKFEEIDFSESLLEGLAVMNYEQMTPIQEKAIPVIMEGRDTIACAQTGTGKTMAYLLPLLDRLQKDGHKENVVNALIMVPTRELVLQIEQQLEGLSYFLPTSSVGIYGGNDGNLWEIQKNAIITGVDIVIATPGRLLSHISMGNINFSEVSYFILDEADRMLDMGFLEDIERIEKYIPKKRQTILFSATMPTKIKKLANSILNKPIAVNVAISKPAEGITQNAYICYENQKVQIINSLFENNSWERAIIFSSKKESVKEITRNLKRKKLNVSEMHSDLDQNERNEVMLNFKNKKINIIVATDIISRGIDIDGLDLVINYDVPNDVEDYIHRIGRTARANKEGLAITFVSEKDQKKFFKIEKFLDKDITKAPIPTELGEGPAYTPGNENEGKRHHNNNRRNYKRSSNNSDKNFNNNNNSSNNSSNNNPRNRNHSQGNNTWRKRPYKNRKNENNHSNTNGND